MPKEKIDEMAATLFAISVLTKKLAKDVLKESMKGVKNIKNKDARHSKGSIEKRKCKGKLFRFSIKVGIIKRRKK